MAKYMAELGLTPSARCRIAVDVSTGPKPWEFDPLDALLDEVARSGMQVGDGSDPDREQ